MARKRPAKTATRRSRGRADVGGGVVPGSSICRDVYINLYMSDSSYDHGVSLTHALLGLLASRPGTGYELRQRFGASLGNAWHASHSQIYPELGRLEERGLVEVIGHGARRSRTWAVTPEGRNELRRWLVEAEPNRDVRNEPLLRGFLLFLLEPADRTAVLRRELAEAERQGADLAQTAAHLDADNGAPAFRPIVDLGQRTNAVLQAWLREQLSDAERTHAGPDA
jgi:DNA-binding PadR family transcriptional regulator